MYILLKLTYLLPNAQKSTCQTLNVFHIPTNSYTESCIIRANT